MLLLAVSEDDDVGKKRTRKWVLDIYKQNMERLMYGEFDTLMPHPRKDEKRFYIYFRMTILCLECDDEFIVSCYKKSTSERKTRIRMR